MYRQLASNIMVTFTACVLSLAGGRMLAAEAVAALDTAAVDSQIESADATQPELADNATEVTAEIAPDPVRQEEIRLAMLQLDAAGRLVTELELQGRGYSLELYTAYMELATAQHELQQFEAADQTLNNALQLVRTEFGLYDSRQLPVLQALFSNNKASTQWDAANSNMYLIDLIARKSYPPGDQRRLDAISQSAGWLIKASAEALVPDHNANLKQVLRRYRFEIAELGTLPSYPERGVQLATLHLDVGAINLELARTASQRPLTDYQTTERRTTTTTYCQMVRVANGLYTQVCSTREIANTDYFVDLSNQLTQELRGYMKATREAIENAFAALGDESTYGDREAALLTEMLGLNQAYNAFLTEKSL